MELWRGFCLQTVKQQRIETWWHSQQNNKTPILLLSNSGNFRNDPRWRSKASSLLGAVRHVVSMIRRLWGCGVIEDVCVCVKWVKIFSLHLCRNYSHALYLKHIHLNLVPGFCKATLWLIVYIVKDNIHHIHTLSGPKKKKLNGFNWANRYPLDNDCSD